MTIADVSFDVPLPHPFSYRVPDGWALVPGQRVVAPLGRTNRTGVVVARHERADATGLKALLTNLETAPRLDRQGLARARGVAEQKL